MDPDMCRQQDEEARTAVTPLQKTAAGLLVTPLPAPKLFIVSSSSGAEPPPALKHIAKTGKPPHLARSIFMSFSGLAGAAGGFFLSRTYDLTITQTSAAVLALTIAALALSSFAARSFSKRYG